MYRRFPIQAPQSFTQCITDVETFITFRSTTPLVLSICDYIFLGRQLPNARSWSCLFVLVLGSIGYVVRFRLGFAWVLHKHCMGSACSAVVSCLC